MALVNVAGLPSVKRTLLTLARAGIKTVHVVVGFEAQRVRSAVEGDPAYTRAGLTIAFIDNPDFEKGSGVAVLKAKPHVSGPFLLSTVNRVYDDAVARAAAAADTSAADLWLCVDARDARRRRRRHPRGATRGRPNRRGEPRKAARRG